MFSTYEAMNGRRVYIRYRNRCPECPAEFANHERGTKLGSFSGLPVGEYIPNDKMKYPMSANTPPTTAIHRLTNIPTLPAVLGP